MALLLNTGNTVSRSYTIIKPSPTHPIQPDECGERTRNLYNINAKDVTNGYVNSAQLNQDGTTEEWGSAEISEYIPISGDTTYTFNGIGSYNSPCYALYDENKQLIDAYAYYGRSTIKFTSPNNARYFRFTHIKTAVRAMMVEGEYTSQTMPAYEPYGIKIPILSANTTTPVYLGEVQTTRQIKKLVLTGKEAFAKNDNQSTHYLYYTSRATILPSSMSITPVLCNELPVKNDAPQTVIGISTNNTLGVVYFNFGADVMNAQPSGNTVEGLKEYLAAQYAAGTPVTVWYVLAEPTTGIVNEPLRKIGDYADEVSVTGIPTITGKDSFDVLTTLKPSEVSLAYTGWHYSTVKEWNGSEWQ